MDTVLISIHTHKTIAVRESIVQENRVFPLLIRRSANISAARNSGLLEMLGGLRPSGIAQVSSKQLFKNILEKIVIKGLDEVAEHLVPYANILASLHDI